jgi:hypothetical protein
MSQKKIINPIAIDREVIPLLEKPKDIRIHSEFENTKNYITDKGLMVVTMIDEILPPLGIVLNSDNFKEFSLEKRKFIIAESRLYSSYMDTYGKYPEGRIFEVYMNRFLEDNLENGLGIENHEIDKILRTSRLINLSEEGVILWQMISGAGEVDIKSIVGRGRGLTPAWDDFLTKAVKGCFSQNILNLVNSIQNNIFDEKSYLNVIKYGGTSGVDTCIGIMSGYASLLGFRTI